MATNHRRGLVRVLFQLEPGAWHGSVTERLWAEPVGLRQYRLNNSPFFAFGVSLGDIVFAEEREGQLMFVGVSIRGGHSTYRIRLTEGKRESFHSYWEGLQLLGCSYEEGQVLAVDVPPGTDIYKVYALLEAGESAEVWEFEEGHCGHPLRA